MNSIINYYKDFRLSKLNTPKYSHIKLLIFWAVYGVAFFLVERVGVNRAWNYMHCGFDDMIPFCEYFVIPYMFWFVYLVGMLIYTFFFDIPSFRRMMWFIIFTYSLAIVAYIIYPSAQDLRPAVFDNDNVFTRFLTGFYNFDTNTNVNPSIHVLGAMSVLFTAWNSPRFSTKGWRAAFMICAVLIDISTVFIKQHSVIDIFSAFLLCVVFYPIVYKNKYTSAPKESKSNTRAEEKTSQLKY